MARYHRDLEILLKSSEMIRKTIRSFSTKIDESLEVKLHASIMIYKISFIFKDQS